MDHAAIFLFTAGSYTPFALREVPGGPGWLVIAGGLAYSAGTLFFLLDKRWRHGHLVWHLFVLAGSGCHLAAVVQALG